MDIVIKTYGSLPCCLMEFTVNGIDADLDDFGEKNLFDGSCMDSECGCEFIPKEPTVGVLIKYRITEAEYKRVCEELSDELYVCDCGCCS